MVALSDPGRLSARATLFPGESVITHSPPHFADHPRALGKVGPEHSPLRQEDTLTTGLSPLESVESHRQSCADTWRHSCHGAAGRIPLLPAADRSRTCLLRCSAHALKAEPLTLQAMWWDPRDRHPLELQETLCKKSTSPLTCPGVEAKPRPPRFSTFHLSVGTSRPSASSAAPEPVLLDTSRVRTLKLKVAPPGNSAAPASRNHEVDGAPATRNFQILASLSAQIPAF